MTFEKIFHDSKIILTEGAIVERLKAEFNEVMDPAINHAGLIYSNPDILGSLYRQYINIAQKYNLPIMVMTPTRRVNAESVKKSTFSDKNLLSDCSLFLNRIRESYHDFSKNILIGGLVGCKGDAYSGEKMMNSLESYQFHKQQAILFQKEKIDFLFAGIMPEINEAIGMANALAETSIPYIISFMITKDGCLMDGTTIAEAITIIDKQVSVKPTCYMTNCVHPTNLIKALQHEKNSNIRLERFCGIQSNASILSPEELNHSNVLHQNDFTSMIEEMDYLHNHFGFKILGGCCGTNDKFLDELSAKLTDSVHTTIN